MLLTIVEKWKGESSREYVTRLLKFNIINLYLHPGEAISENEIAAQLNLSRTPVREAFIRLAQDRLINVFPQKGTSISKIGESSGDEGRFIRRVVEKELVKELCQKEDNAFLIASLEESLFMQKYYVGKNNTVKFVQSDDEFHRIFFNYCARQRMFEVVSSLNCDYYRLRMLKMLSGIVGLESICLQHQELLEAIRAKDGEKAERIIDDHLKDQDQDFLYCLEKYPDYFQPGLKR